MTKEEKDLLLEIENLYNELFQESIGTWNGSYMMKPSGYSYSHKAEMLRDKVFELYDKFKPEYLSINDLEAIAHTCDKEVSYVEYHYNNSIKNNAPKKLHTEFLDSISTANQQIRLDIFSLLTKIDEIKKSNK